MIKTPLSTVLGGVFWTPGCTVIGGQQNTHQLIKSLFADGTQGIYLNAQDAVSVSDLSSIKDLSGRNNHAAQPNATSRATIITDPSGYKSLKFDGVDDGYVTPPINFTNTDKVTVIAAVRKLSDANSAIVCEFSQNVDVNNSAFSLHAPIGTNIGNRFGGRSKGTSVATVFMGTNESLYSAPRSTVLTMQTKIALNLLTLKSNLSASIFRSLESQGAGNYGNYPLYIGRRGDDGSRSFNGQIYALLVIGKLLDDATTAKIEKEFAKYIGVTL